jgi:hypothetical protein
MIVQYWKDIQSLLWNRKPVQAFIVYLIRPNVYPEKIIAAVSPKV